MKRLIFIICLFICIFTACKNVSEPDGDSVYFSNDDENEETRPEYPVILAPSSNRIVSAFYSEGIFCLYDGESYGYVDEGGRELTGFVYDFAYPFSQGLACVRRDGKYGYINLNGDIAIPLIFDKANPFSEGLAYFEINDRYGFMDKAGEERFLTNFDSVSSFSEGLAYFSLDGKYGYIDINGEIIIPPAYDDVDFFLNGLARVRKGPHCGVIDKTGREIIAINYDRVEPDKALIIVQSEDKYGCFNQKGSFVLPTEYEQLRTDGDYIFLGQDGKEGLADMEGAVLLKPSYDSIFVLPGKKLAIVVENSRYGVVDFKGNKILPAIYDWIRCGATEESEILAVNLNEKWGLLDVNDYTEEVHFIYEDFGDIDDNKAVACMEGKYGVIDNTGAEVLPFEYEAIQISEKSDFFCVKQNGKWTLFDQNANQVSKKPYDSITEFGGGFRCEEYGRFGFLNKSGEEILPPTFTFGYSDIYNTDNCYIFRRADSKDDRIVITEAIMKTDMGELQKNEITPRIKQYNEFIRDGHMEITDWENASDITMDVLEHYEISCRLYAACESGNPILYIHAEPYLDTPFPLTYSGFFSIKDKKIYELLTGFQCGGSIGGNYIHLWYDKKDMKTKLGSTGIYGGFGGQARDADIYDYEEGVLKPAYTFYSVRQSVGNYSDNLVQNAHLYYDDRNLPFTKDSVLQAEYVSEYQINGEQTTLENYRESFYSRFLEIPCY